MAISFNELVEAQKKLSEKQKLSAPEKVTAEQLSKMLTKEGAPSAGGGAKNIEKLIKSDKDILESQKKLNKNLERLNNVITRSSLGTGKSGPSNVSTQRGEQLAGEQPLDYRSIGQRIKDKFMGRGGNKFDTNSYRYKLGTLRGLAQTTGLVTKGSGGIADKYLAVREEEKRSADVMGKLNPQMKNLSQFGGSQSKVNDFYMKKAKAASQSKRELQTEQERLEALRASGMSEEEIQRTTGGGRQIEKRDVAATKLINTDPRYKGESLALKGNINNQSESLSSKGKNNDVSEQDQENIDMFNKNNETLDKLVTLTEDENKRKADSDKKLLDAIKGIETSGGGALGGIADMAGNIIGRRGVGAAAGKAGKFGKLGAFAAKNSKMLKIGGGVLAGGIAAYEGYSDYKDADEQVKSGAITEDEGDIKKTGAVTGAAGGLGGALGGAALGTMIMPGVGTVIGGAIGGIAGSKVGKGIGEWGSKTWKGLTGGSNKQIQSPNAEQHSMRMDTSDPNKTKFLVDGKEVSEKDYENIQNGSLENQPKAIRTALNNADQVTSKSAENDAAKLNSKDTAQNNIVNAPTTITKQTQNTIMKTPIRSQETSIRSYYRSRFAT
jgi:hypothetical protein